MIKLTNFVFPEYIKDISDINFSGRVALEIGFGNGVFAVSILEREAFDLFVGIEVSIKAINKTSKKLKKRGISNVVLVYGDAMKEIVVIPDNVISAIYINFPDPCPKREHKRLLKVDFFKECKRILSSGGSVYIATDNENYRDMIVTNYKEAGFVSAFGDDYVLELKDYPKSVYENRFREIYRDIYYMQLIKQ